jgi:ABC-type nitrate/sulfonate/bicarbonate transport system permease component
MDRAVKILKSLVVPLALLCLWEIIARNHIILETIYSFCGYSNEKIPDFTFISSISKIISSLYTMVQTKEFYSLLGDTLKVLVLSFLFSLFLGVCLGSIIGLYRKTEIYIFSIIDVFRSIPPNALLPLFILFLGIDDQMKVAFVLFGGIWPVLINTFFAIRDIEPIYLKVAKNLQLSKFKTLSKVIYPLASPAIFTGIKLSLSLCLILTIVCEMLIGNKGIGFLINVSKRSTDYNAMYAGILVVAILGWLINRIFYLLDQHVLKWYYQKQQ